MMEIPGNVLQDLVRQTVNLGDIINSRINQQMPQVVKDYHMPIKCAKYFLFLVVL